MKTINEKSQYQCEKCKDRGWVLMRHKNSQDSIEFCECRQKQMAQNLMRLSGINEEDLKKGFSSFATFGEPLLITVKDTALKYFKAFKDISNTRNNSLLLCGASGRGKTTLGMAVANNLIHSCINVRYMAYRDEISQLKREIIDEEAYTTHIDKLKTTKVLFIDDLLKGKITESDINILYEIINYRYLERLPIIVSTEKFPEDLLKFDEAIGGRILEMCKGYVAKFPEEIKNYRLR